MLTVRGLRHSFSTHERMFLWKCQSFWDRKCLDLRGTRTPKLWIHAECSNHLSNQGQTFAVPYFLSKVSNSTLVFVYLSTISLFVHHTYGRYSQWLLCKIWKYVVFSAIQYVNYVLPYSYSQWFPLFSHEIYMCMCMCVCACCSLTNTYVHHVLTFIENVWIFMFYISRYLTCGDRVKSV